jgi:hypothetical protein
MNETQKERLTSLAKENGLNKDHFFKSPQGFVIITRQGIERIQAQKGIRVSYEVVSLSDDLKHVVLKATGEMGNTKGLPVQMETFGESAPHNYEQKTSRQGNPLPYYPMAMAEKRALSRVVLKLSGLYEVGVFGEDESDDFKRK